MPRRGKCGGKCFPVCSYHLCEEKGRAAEQDFSTAALQRCWLILKPSWTTAYYNFFFFSFCIKIFSSFGHFSWVLKAQWIFESLEPSDVKFDLWCLLVFFLTMLLLFLTQSRILLITYLCSCSSLYLFLSLSLCPWSILADAIMYWTRLFCYWNLLRFLFRK